MEVRIAERSDLDAVVEILTGAFREDPLWGWVFPGGDGLAEWWRFLVSSALRYPWVWVADDYAAASVWIPPGGTELTPAEEAQVEELAVELAGPRASDLMVLLDRFEEGHPTERPHYYLSLLGTRPDRRGEGIGMALLEENLKVIDGEGAHAYLESSNPVNIPRYEKRGFVPIGGFDRPDGNFTATRMWREARLVEPSP
jgi:GNAT superfamily N-acetyltransferase